MMIAANIGLSLLCYVTLDGFARRFMDRVSAQAQVHGRSGGDFSEMTAARGRRLRLLFRQTISSSVQKTTL